MIVVFHNHEKIYINARDLLVYVCRTKINVFCIYETVLHKDKCFVYL